MSNSRVSTTVAAIALFIVIGGTATAASGLINGKQIKKGTITAKQIKNKTITSAKLTSATVKSLKGKNGTPGPRGTTGPAGTAGVTGPAGQDGVIAPFYEEVQQMNLPADQVMTKLDVPAGQYVLTAKADLTSSQVAEADLNCSIWTDETDAVDAAQVQPVELNETVSMSLMALAQVEAKVEFRCNGNDVVGDARNIKLLAVPVAD